MLALFLSSFSAAQETPLDQHLAHTLPHVLGIAIALFILIYREFQTKDVHQFIHNMHIGTMFALTLAKRELCSSGDTAGFY